MKKLTALLMAGVMTVGLAAFGASPAAASEGADIEIWLASVGAPTEWVTEKIGEWSGENGVNVTVVNPASYDETYTNLQAAIAGGVQPDIVLLDPAPARNLYSKGLTVNLSELGLNADDYVDAFMEQCTYDDGAAFAVPMYGTIQIGYYNVELFNQAGIDPESIESWQDLVEAADKLQGAGAAYVWEPMGGNAKNMIDAAFANGAKVFAEDGKTVTINSPEWVEVFEQFRKWIHEDGIMKTYWGDGWTYWYQTKADVLANKAAGYTGSPVDPSDGGTTVDEETGEEVATSFDFDTLYPREQFGWNGNPSMPWAETLVLCMPVTGDEARQVAAYSLLEYLTSPEISAGYSIISGYAASNKNAAEDEAYKAYAEENPVAEVLAKQATHASVYPIDPTGQGILSALNDAASSIQQDGDTPAQEVLDKAQKIAQAAVDEALAD